MPATGQDAVADHTSPDIDFIAFHSWIDNWQPGVSQGTPHIPHNNAVGRADWGSDSAYLWQVQSHNIDTQFACYNHGNGSLMELNKLNNAAVMDSLHNCIAILCLLLP